MDSGTWRYLHPQWSLIPAEITRVITSVMPIGLAVLDQSRRLIPASVSPSRGAAGEILHVGHLAVAKPDHGVAPGREGEVVGGEQQGGAALAAQLEEQVDDLGAGPGVEVAGGLVGEDERGSLMRARAIATRCCWPPDIRDGRSSSRPDSPTIAKRSRARAGLSKSTLSGSTGAMTLSSAVSAGSRW